MHSNVQEVIKLDFKIFDILLSLGNCLSKNIDFLWLSNYLKAYLSQELNFNNEALNCKKMNKLLSEEDKVFVPEILEYLTTQKILTMSWEEGFPITNIQKMKEENISIDKVSEELFKFFCKCVFVHGFVHADPHPGNILVRKRDDNIELILLLNVFLFRNIWK